MHGTRPGFEWSLKVREFAKMCPNWNWRFLNGEEPNSIALEELLEFVFKNQNPDWKFSQKNEELHNTGLDHSMVQGMVQFRPSTSLVSELSTITEGSSMKSGVLFELDFAYRVQLWKVYLKFLISFLVTKKLLNMHFYYKTSENWNFLKMKIKITGLRLLILKQ